MIEQIFKRHSVIGIVGNRNSGKTSLVLSELKYVRGLYPHLNIAVMGIEKELFKELDKLNIKVIHSKMDILDLKMRDTLIFIDEFALFFDTQTKSKELNKLMRFFDRIEHNNCKLIIGTAREGYFNKFMCARVNAFLIKEIEYESLVNGSWLKERVKAITSVSDYRLELSKDTYYSVTTDLTTKHTFKYSKEFDSKKNNCELFSEIKSESKGDKENERKETKPNTEHNLSEYVKLS
jgi:hypothetical protein